MAAEGEAAQQTQQQQAEKKNEGFLSFAGIGKMVLMYIAIQFIAKTFLKPTQPPVAVPSSAEESSSVNQAQVDLQQTYLPLWGPDAVFNLKVFLSEEQYFTAFHSKPLFEARGLRFSWDQEFEKSLNVSIPASESMQNNGSLFAHVFFVRRGYPMDPKHSQFQPTMVAYALQKLNLHRPRLNAKAGKSLLSKDTSAADGDNVEGNKIAIESADSAWVSYWRPILPIRIVLDFSAVQLGSLPPDIASQYRIESNSKRYYPVIFFEYFWLLQDQMSLINDSVSELPLEITFKPISMMRWTLETQMDASWKQQQSWGSTEKETEQFRRILLESNPYLLGITAAVSVLHMIFDFLAFKNDVQFWRNKKDMEGLSVRTIFLNCFCQLVIFLYLMDNDTSWMILMSNFIGLIIECWKIRQAADCSFVWKEKHGVTFPWVDVKDKAAYVQSGTAQYDKEAMKYLSWALYPLVIGYSIYSLVYQQHKSWYSWVLGSLTGSVYAFGFIMMCPQLYLNYKLKSVAHLPWRMMTYKALNTFIDDLFAFVIKMPWLHRLSCFRDDVIFLIYLYQRWIYRVDYSRVNEFGYNPQDDPRMQEKLASQTEVAESKPVGVRREEDGGDRTPSPNNNPDAGKLKAE